MGQLVFWRNEGEAAELPPVKDNRLSVDFPAIAENEQLARMLVSAFLTPLDPTMEELSDVKTAVSEAVTNAVIHGYPKADERNKIHMFLENRNRLLTVTIVDYGVGIEDIALAMEPMYTSKPELERSGMGFAFMKAFMDTLEVKSSKSEGVTIVMSKVIGEEKGDNREHE